VTDSASSFISLILGLGVFLIIVAVGWRSVQNRRILRMQGADGKETIIVAREDDEISTVVTTTEPARPDPAPSALDEDAGVTEAPPARKSRRGTAKI